METEHSIQSRPIMIIEDDLDDQELLKEAFSTLDYPNSVIFFSNGNDALNYLDETIVPPVLIISDINMPKINGFELRERINKSHALRKLDIPFVFLSTLSQKEAVVNEGSVPDHGFFTKPNSMKDLRNAIKTIVEYWVQRYTPALYFRQPEQSNHLIR